MANNVIFKVGTKEQYNALAVKDSNTLYWLHDVLELRKGEALYGKGAEATAMASGLMSAEDKAKLDNLASGGAIGLTAVDNSVVIEPSEDGMTIGVKVSAKENNALTLEEDGLFVSGAEAVEATAIPEYSIEKVAEAEEGFAATYKLKKTEGENVTYAGDVINIPKDLVLQGGDMKSVETEGEPYDGAVVGDPYIDLVLNDPDNTHIYIPVKAAFGESGQITWEEM